MTTTAASRTLIPQLDAIIEEAHLLKHPFYQAWSAGTLTLEALQDYAKQYWHFARAFPQSVSATHAACPDLNDRQILLENLIEEERGADNHPELWLRFGEALGLSREEIVSSDPLPETQALVQTYRDLTRTNFVQAATALYTYESQVPAIAETKIDGLRRFYGIDDARSVAFFSVHVAADTAHAESGRSMIGRAAKGEGDVALARDASTRAAAALNGMLTGVHERSIAH